MRPNARLRRSAAPSPRSRTKLSDTATGPSAVILSDETARLLRLFGATPVHPKFITPDSYERNRTLAVLKRTRAGSYASAKTLARVVGREVTMKSYVLTGSLAAAVAIAAPVWAQTPSAQYPSAGTPSGTAPSIQTAPSATAPAPYTSSAPSTMGRSSQTAPYAQQTPMPSPSSSATASAPSAMDQNAEKPKTGRHVIHRPHRGHAASTHALRHLSRKAKSPSDNMADQLNREELGRISGSSTAPRRNAAPTSPQGGQSPAGKGY